MYCAKASLLYQVFGCFRSTSSHADYALGRVGGKLSAINQVKQVYPAVICLLYQVYILPIFDVVQLPSNSTATHRLERIYAKFTSSLPSSDTFNLRLITRPTTEQ